MFCPQLKSKNNDLGLFFKTILLCLYNFLSFVTTDGKDGNGLKLENVESIFLSFDVISTKINQKTFLKNFIRYSPPIFCISKTTK